MAEQIPPWIQHLLDNEAKLAQATGGPVGELVRCGRNGCAFHGLEGEILKLTVDEDEAHMAHAILSLPPEQRHGSAHIHGVTELHMTPQRWGARDEYGREVTNADGSAILVDRAWAIRQEEVEPFLRPEALYEREWSATTRRVANSIGALAFGVGFAGLRAYYMHARAGEVEHIPEAIAAMRSQPFSAEIAETLAALYDEGLYLQDLHAHNLGWRTRNGLPYDLVFYDPGGSYTPRGARLPRAFVANRAPYGELGLDVLLRDHQEALSSAVGHDIVDVIACGDWGCAFATMTPGVLVKITSDPDEAENSITIQQLQDADERRHSGAPRVHAVYRLEASHQARGDNTPIYAVVQEQVLPLVVSDRYGNRRKVWHPEFFDALLAGEREREYDAWLGEDFVPETVAGEEFQEVLRYIAEYDDLVHRERASRTYKRDVADTLRNMGDTPWAEALADTLLELFELGVTLDDAHLSNLGWRPRRSSHDGKVGLVVLDPSGRHPDVVAEPARRFVANPELSWMAAQAIESRKGAIGAQLGLQLGEELGRGSFGIAFATNDPTKVVKVTRDSSESETARWIGTWPARKRAGLAKIHRVVDLTVRAPVLWGLLRYTQPMTAIVLERVRPVSDKDFDGSDDDTLREAEEALNRYNEEGRLYTDYEYTLQFNTQDVKFARELRDAMAIQVEKMREELEVMNRSEAFRPLVRSLEYALDEGRPLTDAASYNVGWNDSGHIVLYDFGGYELNHAGDWASDRVFVANPHLGVLDIEAIHDNRQRIGSLTGYRLGRRVGAGSYGVAYATDDPEIVVKVTRDASEGAQARALAMLTEGERRGAARIYEVRDVLLPSDGGHRIPVTIIVQERVFPLEGDLLPELQQIASLAQSIGMLARSWKSAERAGFRDLADEDRGRYFEYVARLAELGGEVADPLARTLRRMGEQGTPVYDLHQGNLGWRYEDDEQYLVFYDLGGGERAGVGLEPRRWTELVANGLARLPWRGRGDR